MTVMAVVFLLNFAAEVLFDMGRTLKYTRKLVTETLVRHLVFAFGAWMFLTGREFIGLTLFGGLLLWAVLKTMTRKAGAEGWALAIVGQVWPMLMAVIYRLLYADFGLVIAAVVIIVLYPLIRPVVRVLIVNGARNGTLG